MVDLLHVGVNCGGVACDWVNTVGRQQDRPGGGGGELAGSRHGDLLEMMLTVCQMENYELI